MIKAVICDVDNTLVDFMRIKRIAIEGAAEAMIDAGLNISLEHIIENVYSLYWKHGMEDQQVFERFLKKELGKVDYEILGCAIAEYRRRKANVTVTYPRVRKTLIELIRMGLKLAVLSDAPRIPLYTRIATLKLNKYFNAIVTAEDCKGKHKPEPEPFLHVCKTLDLKPEECIMVGDWEERDMVGASNVGMITAFAAYGDEWDIKEPRADYILNDGIYQIVDIVKDINTIDDEKEALDVKHDTTENN